MEIWKVQQQQRKREDRPIMKSQRLTEWPFISTMVEKSKVILEEEPTKEPIPQDAQQQIQQ